MTLPFVRPAVAGLETMLIGRSLVMQRLRARVAQVAPLPVSVLLVGPTGVGKEVVAQALHTASGRRGEFVGFNICAIAEPMFEDVLFGHVRGAFTGAVRDKHGHFAEADQGTLFLDEIGDLSMASQVKLLRAIELGCYRPVGGQRDRLSDFRTVAATNADLAALVRQGRFREDLYYRLGAAVLRVPPLSARREDIPELVRHFVKARGAAREIEIAPEALDVLAEHDWPGNVRELRHVVECALGIAGDGGCISAYDVSAAIDGDRASAPAAVAVRDEGARGFRSFAGGSATLRRYLVEALHEEGGNVVAVAARFDVCVGTVYRWLRTLGLPTPRYNRSKMRNAPREERSGQGIAPPVIAPPGAGLGALGERLTEVPVSHEWGA